MIVLTRSLLAFAAFSLVLQMAMGQNAPSSAELTRYTSDTLGFSIDLPCIPVWQPPDIPTAKPVFGCELSAPKVMVGIHNEPQTIHSNKELDAFLKKYLPEIPALYGTTRVTRTQIDGHRARRVTIAIEFMHSEFLFVAHGNRVHVIGLASEMESLIDPKILQSIKLR